MALIGIIVVLSISLFAYGYFNGRSGLHPNPSPEENDIRIACVGDSITYGSTVTNWPKNNYPVLLDSLLGDGYTVCNYGVSGVTLLSTGDKPYVNTSVYADSIAFAPDIVIIMLGTNDSKINNWTNEADFENQLVALIQAYMNLETMPTVFLCTPCKAYSDIYKIQESEVSKIVKIVRNVAQQNNIPIIEIRELSEAHPEWFAKDGVHPNNNGAAAIAQTVYEALLKETKENNK